MSSLEQNTFSVLDNFVYWAKGLVFLLIFIFIKKIHVESVSSFRMQLSQS